MIQPLDDAVRARVSCRLDLPHKGARGSLRISISICSMMMLFLKANKDCKWRYVENNSHATFTEKGIF